MFEEHYEVIDGIRLHYVDEGSGPPILLVHGQPTWSYLYRKMIQPLVAAGYRCISPDLMGFGLSDKPTDESAYTLKRHVELVTGLVERLQIQGVTIVGQDWGGPIGLRYAIDHQDNVRSLVILNTLVRTTPVPLPFTLVFRNGGLSSFRSEIWTCSGKWPSGAAGRSGGPWKLGCWSSTECPTQRRPRPGDSRLPQDDSRQ